MIHINRQHILVSRVDAIGDVVLTLPLCGLLKQVFPGIKISFLGRTYTRPVIQACTAIDHFINYDDLKALPLKQQIAYISALNIDIAIHVFPNKQIGSLLKKAGIKTRIGTTNRLHHWFSCNKLVKLSRKQSNLHEAQLNIKLLKPLGITATPTLSQLPGYYNFKPLYPVGEALAAQIDDGRFNLIIHPKSNGSAREWSLDNFAQLIGILPADRFRIFITGSEKEKALLSNWVKTLSPHVIDLTGSMTLEQLTAFISKADGLIAASTGPLHIAAAAGIHALGLYPASQAINAKRWGPIGTQAQYLQSSDDDLNHILPATVQSTVLKWLSKPIVNN